MIAPPPARTDVPTPTDILTAMPFAEACGIRLQAVSTAAVIGALDWDAARCTVGGVMHGGALMVLADTVGAVAAFLHLPEGVSTATVDSTTHLLGAVREGTVEATATVVHAGRTRVVVRTDLRVGERLVATTTQTQAVLPARPGA